MSDRDFPSKNQGTWPTGCYSAAQILAPFYQSSLVQAWLLFIVVVGAVVVAIFPVIGVSVAETPNMPVHPTQTPEKLLQALRCCFYTHHSTLKFLGRPSNLKIKQSYHTGEQHGNGYYWRCITV